MAKKRNKKPVQHLMPWLRQPGPGRRLGRPKSPTSGVSHLTRPRVKPYEPQHVTLKLAQGLPSLRTAEVLHRLIDVFAAARDRNGMRLVHYSIQQNHIHLVIEAESNDSLARSMKGLTRRIAAALNKIWKRVGAIFADRYHQRPLPTPREVFHAIAYVLRNAFHHGRCGRNERKVDVFTSGLWFDGWPEPVEVINGPPVPPILPPRTWLLSTGWRRYGPIPFLP